MVILLTIEESFCDLDGSDQLDALLVHTSDVFSESEWHKLLGHYNVQLVVLYSAGGAPEGKASKLLEKWPKKTIKAFSNTVLTHRLKESLDSGNIQPFLRPPALSIALDLLNALWFVGLQWEMNRSIPECLSKPDTLRDFKVSGRDVGVRWEKMFELTPAPSNPWNPTKDLTPFEIFNNLKSGGTHHSFQKGLESLRDALMKWAEDNNT
jgi:hypothetical protein